MSSTKFTAQDVFAEIDRQATSQGLDPKVARAFFIAENSANGTMTPMRVIDGAVKSPAGARGVMQTMPGTEELLKKAGFLPSNWQFNAADLPTQVQAGLAAIKEKQSRQKNKGDVLELAAMYNAGSKGWQQYRAGELDQLPAETKHYFTKIKTALGLPMEQATTPTTPANQPTGASASSASRATIRSTRFDPLALDAALQMGNNLIQNGGTFDAAFKDIADVISGRRAAEQATQVAVQDYAVKQGAATTARTAVEAGEAARRSQILSAAAVNPADANNKANQAMQQIIMQMPQLEAEGAEIDKRAAVGIFDNPLEWLVNQVRLPGMVGQYNAKVRSTNRAIDGAKQLQGLAATQITLGQASDADAIAKAGLAAAAEQASASQVKLKQLQEQATGAQLRDIETAVNMQTQKARTAIDLAQLTKQYRSENVGVSEKQAMEAAQEIQLKRVNDWLKMIGSEQQYTGATFKMLPAKAREDLLNSAGTTGISRNLWEGAKAIDSLGSWEKIAQQGNAATATWLRGTLGEVQQRVSEELKVAEQQAKISGKPIAKREEFLETATAAVEARYKAELGDMRSASKNNPYKLGYDAMVKNPALQGNPVTEFLKASGPTSPKPVFSQVDERLVLDYMTGQVLAGQMKTGDAAAAIAGFYKTAMNEQAKLTQYSLFGFSPAKDYRVSVPAPGFFESRIRAGAAGGGLDLANQAQVESYLLSNSAAVLSKRGLLIPGMTTTNDFVAP